MDTTGDPLVLRIKRVVEKEIGLPVVVAQYPDNRFEIRLEDSDGFSDIDV